MRESRKNLEKIQKNSFLRELPENRAQSHSRVNDNAPLCKKSQKSNKSNSTEIRMGTAIPSHGLFKSLQHYFSINKVK